MKTAKSKKQETHLDQSGRGVLQIGETLGLKVTLQHSGRIAIIRARMRLASGIKSLCGLDWRLQFSKAMLKLGGVDLGSFVHSRIVNRDGSRNG